MPEVKVVYDETYMKVMNLPFLPHASDENFIRLGESDTHEYGVLVDLQNYSFDLETGTVEMHVTVCKDVPWSALPPTPEFLEKHGWTKLE